LKADLVRAEQTDFVPWLKPLPVLTAQQHILVGWPLGTRLPNHFSQRH